MSLPKVYNWERTRAALKLLSDSFPESFPSWVLIGGGACWFYRESLKRAADPDFRVPQYAAQEEMIWLSKDVDFMGLTEAESEELFRAPLKVETHTISYHGLEVDFLEEGLRLTMDNVQSNVREVRASDFTFYVVDPSLLYAEKCSLLANKERAQDRLHHALLAEFLKYELCTDAEDSKALDARDWVARARTIKTVDHDFFAKDPLLIRRLANGICRLTEAAHKSVRHWAKHHLPGYTE